MPKPEKVLIVDDEQGIRELVRINLESEGYEISEAENGQRAVEIVQSQSDIDIIIMDIMMPVVSGTDAAAEIRRFSNAPILFLTAKTKDEDKNEAYVCGGDDFLGKPFSRIDLINKVRSLIRRYKVYKGKSVIDENTIAFGSTIFDKKRHTILKDEQIYHLTEKEYELLDFLLDNRGTAWSIEAIYKRIWREKYLPTSANTVMVHILRLRQKLEDDPANPIIIRSVYGKGYQIEK